MWAISNKRATISVHFMEKPLRSTTASASKDLAAQDSDWLGVVRPWDAAGQLSYRGDTTAA
jgi:hypothetical protein